MLISSQAAPYFIAVFIAVTPGKLPEQGWVQMLRPFETREACMTEENINAINEEFGHPQNDDVDDNKEAPKIGV